MTIGQWLFSCSLPKWQAVKLTFFAPCDRQFILFIFSSIYLFYKLFILYYKIEELKMLFVELNIRLQE